MLPIRRKVLALAARWCGPNGAIVECAPCALRIMRSPCIHANVLRSSIVVWFRRGCSLTNPDQYRPVQPVRAELTQRLSASTMLCDPVE